MKELCKEFYSAKTSTEIIKLYLSFHIENNDYGFCKATNTNHIPECLYHYLLSLKIKSRFSYDYNNFIRSVMNNTYKVPESIFLHVLQHIALDSSSNLHYFCCAAKNEFLTEKIYVVLYELIRRYKSSRGLECLVLNKKFPLHIIEKEVLGTIKDTTVMKAICKRTDITEELLQYFFKINQENAEYIAYSKKKLSYKFIEKLYSTSNRVVLAELAKRNDLPKHLQKKLAKKHDFNILNSLIDNEIINKNAIKIISKKRIKKISGKAKNRLNHGNKL